MSLKEYRQSLENKEYENKKASLDTVKSVLDPVSALDQEFFHNEGSKILKEKRDRDEKNYETLRQAEQKEYWKLRKKAEKAIKTRDSALIEFVTDGKGIYLDAISEEDAKEVASKNPFVKYGTNSAFIATLNKNDIKIPSNFKNLGKNNSATLWDSNKQTRKNAFVFHGHIFDLIEHQGKPGMAAHEARKNFDDRPLQFGSSTYENRDEISSVINENGENLLKYWDEKDEYSKLAVAYVIKQTYPSIQEYEASPKPQKDYPAFVDYLERLDNYFPSSRQADTGCKKWIKYGSQEYAKHMIKLMQAIAATNAMKNFKRFFLKQGPDNKITIKRSKNYDTLEGDPLKNTFMLGLLEKENKDTILTKNDFYIYWWPRPRKGFGYVVGIGYINPFYVFKSSFYFTKIELDKDEQYIHPIVMMVNFLAGAPQKAFDLTVEVFNQTISGILKIANPITISRKIFMSTHATQNAWEELNRVTGGTVNLVERVTLLPSRAIAGESIEQKDWNELTYVGLQAGLIAVSGGSTAALIGTGAGVLKKGTLVDSDEGRTLLAMVETAAIVYAAGETVSKAAKKMAKKTAIKEGKGAIKRSTDLEETILGRTAIEFTGKSANYLYESDKFVKALKDASFDTTSKQATAEVAKDNPYAALAISGIGYSQRKESKLVPEGTYTSGEGIFDAIDWSKLGKGAKRFAKNIAPEKKDVIGSAIAVHTGHMNKDQVARQFASDKAKQNIERFNKSKPAYVSAPKKKEKVKQVEKEVNKYKAAEAASKAVSKGNINEKNIRAIAEVTPAAEVMDQAIDTKVPKGGKADVWKELNKIGIPQFGMKLPSAATGEFGADLDKSLPAIDAGVSGIGSYVEFDTPDWMKTSNVPDTGIDKAYDDYVKGKIPEEVWKKEARKFLMTLIPLGVPLKKPGSKNPFDFNYKTPEGLQEVRPRLRYGIEHPLITTGHIPRKLTDRQIQYRQQRIKEMEKLLKQLKKREGGVETRRKLKAKLEQMRSV